MSSLVLWRVSIAGLLFVFVATVAAVAPPLYLTRSSSTAPLQVGYKSTALPGHNVADGSIGMAFVGADISNINASARVDVLSMSAAGDLLWTNTNVGTELFAPCAAAVLSQAQYDRSAQGAFVAVFGGVDSSGTTPSPLLQIVDLSTPPATVAPVASRLLTSTARVDGAAASCSSTASASFPDTAVYAFGSDINQQLTRQYDVYSASTDSILASGALPVAHEPRFGPTGLSAGRYCIIAGGQSDIVSNVFTTQVSRYDAVTHTWDLNPGGFNLSLARLFVGAGYSASSSTAVFAGGMYLDAGGTVRVLTDVVELWYLATNTWSITHLPGGGRMYASLAVFQDVVYVGGGSADSVGNPTILVEALTLSTKTWVTVVPGMSSGRLALSGATGALVTPDSLLGTTARVVIVGAADSNSRTVADVFALPMACTLSNGPRAAHEWAYVSNFPADIPGAVMGESTAATDVDSIPSCAEFCTNFFSVPTVAFASVAIGKTCSCRIPQGLTPEPTSPPTLVFTVPIDNQLLSSTVNPLAIPIGTPLAITCPRQMRAVAGSNWACGANGQITGTAGTCVAADTTTRCWASNIDGRNLFPLPMNTTNTTAPTGPTGFFVVAGDWYQSGSGSVQYGMLGSTTSPLAVSSVVACAQYCHTLYAATLELLVLNVGATCICGTLLPGFATPPATPPPFLLVPLGAAIVRSIPPGATGTMRECSLGVATNPGGGAGQTCQSGAWVGTAPVCELKCSSPGWCGPGTCTDLAEGFLCTCDTGYTGAQCQTIVDHCASSPCPSDTTCVPSLNAYACLCDAERFYAGNCSSPMPETGGGGGANVGLIAGVTLGLVAFIVGGIVFVCWWRKGRSDTVTYEPTDSNVMMGAVPSADNPSVPASPASDARKMMRVPSSDVPPSPSDAPLSDVPPSDPPPSDAPTVDSGLIVPTPESSVIRAVPASDNNISDSSALVGAVSS